MYENDKKPLYFLYTIQRSNYRFGVKWRNIKDMVMKLFGDDICSRLIDDKIINTCSDNNALEVINLQDIKYDISTDDKNDTFNKFMNYYKNDKLVTGLMKLTYVDRKISEFFINVIKENMNVNNISSKELTASTPIIMSDDFYYSGAFADYFEKDIINLKFNIESIEPYLKKTWFIETIMAIRDGITTSKTEKLDPDYVNGLLNLIKNDYLTEIILNIDSFLNNDRVSMYINKYNYRRIEEKRLKKFYDWLAIGNDIMVGFEFVIGSILFLPYLPPVDSLHGVYLFIVGSCQLLIRPVIQITRKIHLFFLYRNR